MADKKLIATTVSSREKGIRRREEGETTSSQRMISIQGNQEESRKNLMKAEDESPTHTRNSKNDNDDETKRMEDMRGRGGGRLKHRTVDGDVPLCCWRSLSHVRRSVRTVVASHNMCRSGSHKTTRLRHGSVGEAHCSSSRKGTGWKRMMEAVRRLFSSE